MTIKLIFSQLIVSSQNIKNKDKILDKVKPDKNGFVSSETSKKILEKYILEQDKEKTKQLKLQLQLKILEIQKLNIFKK